MVKLILVRHSKAKEIWEGDKIGRPLSKTGRTRAEFFARKLLTRYGHNIDLLATSEYQKARQTGDILAAHLKPRHREILGFLNPKHDNFDLRQFVLGLKFETIMLVGHFPELSKMAERLTGIGYEKLYLKKPSCLELTFSGQKKPLITFQCDYDSETLMEKSVFKKTEADPEPIAELTMK